jgi:hypothetical protein
MHPAVYNYVVLLYDYQQNNFKIKKPILLY